MKIIVYVSGSLLVYLFMSGMEGAAPGATFTPWHPWLAAGVALAATFLASAGAMYTQKEERERKAMELRCIRVSLTEEEAQIIEAHRSTRKP